MIKFIRNYFKMKAQEIQLKLTIYSAINGTVANYKDIIEVLVKLFESVKNVPADELQCFSLKDVYEKYLQILTPIILEKNENEKQGK